MSNVEHQISHLVGLKITAVEVISIAQILRIFFDDKWQMDISGGWRYRSSKSTLLGGMDVGFYVEFDDAYLNEEDSVYTKKASSLKGRKITKMRSENGDLFFDISGDRFIDIFNLSSSEISIFVKSFC